MLVIKVILQSDFSGCGVGSACEEGVCGGGTKSDIFWLALLVLVLVVLVLAVSVLVLLLGMAIKPMVVVDMMVITCVVFMEMSWWFS